MEYESQEYDELPEEGEVLKTRDKYCLQVTLPLFYKPLEMLPENPTNGDVRELGEAIQKNLSIVADLLDKFDKITECSPEMRLYDIECYIEASTEKLKEILKSFSEEELKFMEPLYLFSPEEMYEKRVVLENNELVVKAVGSYQQEKDEELKRLFFD
jgi:hypothetical protein